MSKKHYDNKNDILRKLRSHDEDVRYAESSTFSAYMLMALYVLRTTCNFETEQAEEFVDSFSVLNEQINSGEVKVEEIIKLVKDELGMEVEGPARITK